MREDSMFHPFAEGGSTSKRLLSNENIHSR